MPILHVMLVASTQVEAGVLRVGLGPACSAPHGQSRAGRGSLTSSSQWARLSLSAARSAEVDFGHRRDWCGCSSTGLK